ncbi:MAG: SPFH domain-containing protein [Bacteroidales bacterium]
MKNQTLIKGIIILVLAALIVFVLSLFVRMERIDAGHTGIRVNLVGDNKGVDDITEVTGWVVYMPLFTAIYEFPIYTQVKDYEVFRVNAKDGSEFTVDPTLSYYVHQDSVPRIFRQYRKSLRELENGYLKNVIYDCYRLTANSFSSDSLMSNRGVFEEEVQSRLETTLRKEGFIYQQLTSNITPPQSLKDAIDSKNRTIQEAMQAENKVRQAEADARIRRIKAETEKYENDMKASALTPLIIQQMYIEKWDGKLPVYGEVPQLLQTVK